MLVHDFGEIRYFLIFHKFAEAKNFSQTIFDRNVRHIAVTPALENFLKLPRAKSGNSSFLRDESNIVLISPISVPFQLHFCHFCHFKIALWRYNVTQLLHSRNNGMGMICWKKKIMFYFWIHFRFLLSSFSSPNMNSCRCHWKAHNKKERCLV